MSWLKSKKASHVLSVYWFVILILVAIGIYAMISTYYSYPTDVRQWEANVLANKAMDCVSKNGVLVEGLKSGKEFEKDFQENFDERCGFNFADNNYDKTQYYVNIDFYEVSSLDKIVFNVYGGNPSWGGTYNEVQQEKTFERIVQGTKKRFYVVDSERNQYLAEVVSVVRKSEQNVKL